MVVHIEVRSVPAVAKLMKEYLGWDKCKPLGGVAACKKLCNRGLHTFHGMLGYCMHVILKDHYEMVATTIFWPRI